MSAMTDSRLAIDTTCPYCGVGCGVRAEVRDDRLIAVAGSEQHPANLGKLCVKGSALHETMGAQGRLLRPRVDGEETDWPTAIDAVAGRLAAVRAEHGPEAIAFYLSGQLLTEDYYVANKLAKGFIGTGHVDTNSRLCMSSAVAGHKRAFGADAVPCSYEDLELCDLLVLVGSNAAWTHPVLYRRIVAAKQRNPRMKIVVLDPRRTATCDAADLHLPVTPGSDGFVFAGLLAWLEHTESVDREYIARHTEGFAQALANAREHTLTRVAERAGVDPAALMKFYGWFAETRQTVTFFSQGVNQSSSGTDKCNAIINCHLATGRIGQPGMGPFSITGQPNAMGGREVGGLANTLAAHMDYSPATRELVAGFWRTDRLSAGPGHKAVDLFDAVARGRIKAIWIMGTNPVVSLPDADRVRAALQQCETVIVSDCIAGTDTTATADILLPAMGWGEKSGTVTNSERRISRQRALVSAPGEARPDWWILSQVAARMGFAEAFSYTSVRDVFVEHAALSGYRNDGTRLFDISALAGLSEAEYDALAPVQWPVNARHPRGTSRLFGEGRFATDTGRARFVAVIPQAPKQKTNRKFPFALNTGRVRDQWHTMTRTGRTAKLLNHIDAPFVLMHPAAAAAHAIEEGDLVEVRTRRGSVEVLASLEPGMDEQQLFVPIHWNDQFASRARVGALLAPLTDPVSGQPEFKHTPAAIRRLDTPAWAMVISRRQLACSEFLFWSVVPLADGRGYFYKLAASAEFDWEECVRRIQPEGASCASFANSSQADRRFLCYDDGQVQLALFSGPGLGALPQADWLQSLLVREISGSPWQLLAGRDIGQENQGRKICSCFNVGERQIVEAIAQGACSAEALGQQLRCGTNCGSCIPELNHLISQAEQAGAA